MGLPVKRMNENAVRGERERELRTLGHQLVAVKSVGFVVDGGRVVGLCVAVLVPTSPL